MRRTFRFIAASVATCALAGCEKQAVNSPKPTPPSASANVVGGLVPDSARNQGIPAINVPTAVVAPEPDEKLDLNEDRISDPIALVTADIDTTIRLGAWLKSHPADRVGRVAPVGTSIDDTFCRSAVVKTQIGKRTLVRSALFYIPIPPSGEKLPIDSASVAEEYCDLRTMVLVSETTDFPTAQSLADSLTAVIDKRLGSHINGGLALTVGGIGGIRDGKMWRRAATSVVIGTSQPEDARPVNSEVESVDSGTPEKARVFVVGYAPGSPAEGFDEWEARYEERHGQTPVDRQSRYRNIDSAAMWSGMPAFADDLKTVVGYLRVRDENNPRDVRPAQVDAALLRALKAIHDSAASLPPARRAAALLAGDIALDAAISIVGTDSNHRIMRALPSVGLTFPEDPNGYGPQNPRAWLWEAYHTDSTGRAGRAAFVELLSLTWPEDKSCGGQEYKRMIERGEAELAAGDTNPLVHYYVGSAYKSIYDLAHFHDSEVGNPEAFKSQAEPARLKAIEHFRAALQSLPDRATRREAWMKAMRLLLRRSGQQPEYVCFPD